MDFRRLTLAALIGISVLPTGGFAASAKAKKTVCTVTINSSDEADKFRQHLSPDQWNFVELTDAAEAQNPNWFQKACDKNISCDMLIISGHFAGTFFGLQSDLRLSMESLESRSCSTSCRGILKQPKEVFLFGCNTLASKEKDNRSPEVYQQTLIRDGFTPAQASQVAAFRYSALGDSFRERMTQVFSNTPRIYGFTAMGPSGVTASPLIERYLRSSGRFYENFEASSRTLGTDQNANLKSAFKNSTIAQAAGVFASKSKRPSETETPYCYLGNESNSRVAKLKFIQKSLTEGNAFGFISHINEFISEEQFSRFERTPEESEILKEIGHNSKIRKDFEQYLKLPGEVYLPVRINVLNLMKSLGILSEAESAIRISANLNLDFSRPIVRKTIDNVCAYELSTDLDIAKIPEARWSEYETFEIMRCLRPRNHEIHDRILQAFLKDPKVTFIASAALGAIRPRAETFQRALMNTALTSTNQDLRRYSIDILGDIQSLDLQIESDLVLILKSDKDVMIRQNVAYAYRQIRTNQVEILRALVNSMLHDPEWSVRSAAGEALTIQNSHIPEIEAYRYIWEDRVP